MLRSKGLTEKLLLLGVDGMDPRFTKRLVDEGKLPNVKKLMERGSCRDDLMLLGANPTITPPMWATLATGCYPMTHGIMDYNISPEEDRDIIFGAFSSKFLKAQPLFNITAEAGKKTLVMHWPGGSFPPSIDSENLFTIDGSSPGACCAWSSARGLDMLFVASTKAEKPSYMPMSITTTDIEGDEKLVFGKTPYKGGVTPEAKERLKNIANNIWKLLMFLAIFHRILLLMTKYSTKKTVVSTGGWQIFQPAVLFRQCILLMAGDLIFQQIVKNLL